MRHVALAPPFVPQIVEMVFVALIVFAAVCLAGTVLRQSWWLTLGIGLILAAVLGWRPDPGGLAALVYTVLIVAALAALLLPAPGRRYRRTRSFTYWIRQTVARLLMYLHTCEPFSAFCANLTSLWMTPSTARAAPDGVMFATVAGMRTSYGPPLSATPDYPLRN